MNLRTVSLLAGFFCITLAIFTQGLLPMLEPQSRYTKVTKVVRTDYGELKWMEDEATKYTDLEMLGRNLYKQNGCWYCHSQYVRPVTGETRRWGPVTQSGEYAYDIPHLFSTRRIGPDLSRVGMKYSDEWHLAHFWDPRMVVPDSIMPRFAELFEGPYENVKIVEDEDGNKTLDKQAETGDLFDFNNKEKILLTPNAEGLVFVPEKGKNPVIWVPNEEFTGETVQVIAQTTELKGLIAYLQKLGMDRGKWRDVFEPQRIEAAMISIPKSKEWIGYGQEVYERRCEGCHGVNGDGNGPAATFMYNFRPRNFTQGVFKFRLTPSGSLPQDGDLFRTITQGIRGSAMPSWHMLPSKDRIAVIQYIKYVLAVDKSDGEAYAYFTEEPPEAPIYIGVPPEPSEEIVTAGSAVWKQAKCWECHGDSGKGDGEKSAELTDDFEFPIRPANLTTGQFKSGPSVKDIFRTITTGLSGTPMPSYGDSLSEEDRWSLAYYILSLSAFTNPLTGKPLNISQKDRIALNDRSLITEDSSAAYRRIKTKSGLQIFGGAAWASKKGFDMALPKAKPNAQISE